MADELGQASAVPEASDSPAATQVPAAEPSPSLPVTTAGDAQQAPVAGAPSGAEPELLAGKFADQDALVKGYLDLQKHTNQVDARNAELSAEREEWGDYFDDDDSPTSGDAPEPATEPETVPPDAEPMGSGATSMQGFAESFSEADYEAMHGSLEVMVAEMIEKQFNAKAGREDAVRSGVDGLIKTYGADVVTPHLVAVKAYVRKHNVPPKVAFHDICFDAVLNRGRDTAEAAAPAAIGPGGVPPEPGSPRSAQEVMNAEWEKADAEEAERQQLL